MLAGLKILDTQHNSLSIEDKDLDGQTDTIMRPKQVIYSSQSLLGYDAMWCCGMIPTFWRTLLLPSSLHPADRGSKVLKSSNTPILAVFDRLFCNRERVIKIS
jgi:hypothetical protein